MSATPHPALQGTAETGTSRLDAARYVTDGLWLDIDGVLHDDGERPRLTVSLLPEAATQPVISPRMVIHHTQSGPKLTPWQSLVSYWRRSDVAGEAHLIANLDGSVVQAMPFIRRADCNYRANSFRVGLNPTLRGAIAWEAQDYGQATVDSTPFTWEQIKTFADIDALLCICYGIGCGWPVSWDGTGIGPHNLFPEWSLRTPNQCPGKVRRSQIPAIHNAVAERLALFGKFTGWQCRATA